VRVPVQKGFSLDLVTRIGYFMPIRNLQGGVT
jgi:hypothetical protein